MKINVSTICSQLSFYSSLQISCAGCSLVMNLILFHSTNFQLDSNSYCLLATSLFEYSVVRGIITLKHDLSITKPTFCWWIEQCVQTPAFTDCTWSKFRLICKFRFKILQVFIYIGIYLKVVPYFLFSCS